MAIYPFRKSVIKKMESKFFKGGVQEKEELARIAGSSGFSERRMDQKLKELGYDPKRRKKIMNNKPEKEEVKKVSPYLMQKAGKDGQETKYAGGSVFTRQKFAGREAILGQAGGGVHGSAENRFGIKKGQTGFAKSAPKSSSDIPSSPPPRLSGGRSVIPLSK
ncbi:MAG: hypothetical protein U9R14_00620 [Patescibacteria group bacterium]|nr:hypothetical protein [Patescibacteria group bacterium]